MWSSVFGDLYCPVLSLEYKVTTQQCDEKALWNGMASEATETQALQTLLCMHVAVAIPGIVAACGLSLHNDSAWNMNITMESERKGIYKQGRRLQDTATTHGHGASGAPSPSDDSLRR